MKSSYSGKSVVEFDIGTIGAGLTSNVDVELVSHGIIGVQVDVTYNAGASSGVDVEFFQSFADNVDTISWGDDTPTFTAGSQAISSYVVTVSGTILRISLTNSDGAQDITDAAIRVTFNMDN